MKQKLNNKPLTFDYEYLRKLDGRLRACLAFFVGTIFIIQGLNGWKLTGRPNILFVFFTHLPTFLVSVILVLVGYAPLIFAAAIGAGFFLTTHPTIIIQEEGKIKVETFFVSSNWIDMKECLVIRKPEKFCLIIPNVNPIFIFNGLWYLKKWKRTVVIDKNIRNFPALYKCLKSHTEIVIE